MHNPLTCRNAFDSGMRKRTYSIAKLIDNMCKSGEAFVAKTMLPDPRPHLLDGVHFWSSWRKISDFNIFWDDHGSGAVPSRAVTYQENEIIGVFIRQPSKKDIHALCVAVRQHQKEGITAKRFNRAIRVAVLPDVMTRNRRSGTLTAPAISRLVDAAKSGFVLKHKTDILMGIICS